jgi:hypothetical protein
MSIVMDIKTNTICHVCICIVVYEAAIWTCAYKNDSKEKCETMIKLTIPEVGYFAFPLL